MYIQRNQQKNAARLLKNFPVLSLIGPRQSGKTTLAKDLGQGWKYFDLERPSDFNIIFSNPEAFFEENSSHVIIDEAQEFPEIFKILRGVIDSQREKNGRFILTGSSSPLLFEHLSDTLAGRVGILNIRTLKANEYYQKPLSDFYEIFKSELPKQNIEFSPMAITNQQMRYCWLYGGYPEPLLRQDPEFFVDWVNNYNNTYINRDIAKLFPRLDRRAYQRFLSTLAGLSGTLINKSDLARAIEVSEGSVREYLQIAEQTFLWRTIDHMAGSKLKSIVKRPKGYVTDSGILNYLARIDTIDKLLASPQAGRNFESFVIEEIIKGIEASNRGNVEFSYYRTTSGAEVDLIVDCMAGRIPIEVKMASVVPASQLRSLNQFILDYDLPYGLLINQSNHIAWITDRILQIPLGKL